MLYAVMDFSSGIDAKPGFKGDYGYYDGPGKGHGAVWNQERKIGGDKEAVRFSFYLDIKQ